MGKYLRTHQDLSLRDMQERLEKKRLQQRALKDKISAVFELSWRELDEEAKEVACMLSLFAVAPIPWFLVEQCLSEKDEEDLEDIRDEQLVNLSLLKRK